MFIFKGTEREQSGSLSDSVVFPCLLTLSVDGCPMLCKRGKFVLLLLAGVSTRNDYGERVCQSLFQ